MPSSSSQFSSFAFVCGSLTLSLSLSLTLLARQHVNDAPRRREEQWVDGCLCDGCGVLAKTKEKLAGCWAAAGSNGPCLLDLSLFARRSSECCVCVRLQPEVSERSAHSSKTGTTQTTHRAPLQPPQRRARKEADALTVHVLLL